jgi:hypothetical protein
MQGQQPSALVIVLSLMTYLSLSILARYFGESTTNKKVMPMKDRIKSFLKVCVMSIFSLIKDICSFHLTSALLA